MPQKLKTTVEVANWLQIEEHKLNYAMRIGRLPQPKLRMAGRKLFTAREIKKVAEFFGVQVPTEVSHV